ncbi:acetolactate decarboxylase [Nakamurella deserti]|uniref:acetolactate decarboxylase n=1 Tax=Nakamurella deserti TaxID=2164074 RepID=UPI000DBE034E|nr:acetolactate decarboxylase [Nakamurella deserti]
MTTPVRHPIFQTSLMSALLDGVYDGEMTVAELLRHGDFGLGTFNALDGEMVVLDGVCHQLRGSGEATVAAPDARTPFAVLTRFQPHVTTALPPDRTREQVVEIIHDLVRSENYCYAIRITGDFSWVRTRTAARQTRPYPPLTAATRGEPVVTFTDVSGVVAGFRTPLYEQGIGVPGGHVHFLDAARAKGGHVLDYLLARGTLEICVGTDLHVSLPLTDAFRDADLAPADLAVQISATENHS